MIDITPALEADAALLAQLSRETFYDTFAADNTAEDMELFMSTSFAVQRLMAEAGDPQHIFFIARENGEPLGYLKLSLSPNPPQLGDAAAIEIARIYAVQKAIGKGVGAALMRQALEMAAAFGKSVIWLGVWERNLKAISFYKKWGFEKFGEHPFILGADAQTDWLMKRSVAG
jgi:diamine N-acetyltransferase